MRKDSSIFLCWKPSSIYSWSIGHILEHEFFCLGHLGCAGSKAKKVDLRNYEQLFRVVFSTFGGQKKYLKFFNMFVLTTNSWKNHSQKLLIIPQIHSFFLTALTAQTAQTEEFLFHYVAYWLTVYRTGILTFNMSYK